MVSYCEERTEVTSVLKQSSQENIWT